MKSVLFICSFVLIISVSAAESTEKQLPGTPTSHVDEDRYLLVLARIERLEKRDKEQQREINTLRSELNIEKRRTSRLEGLISQFHRKHGEPTSIGVAEAVDPYRYSKSIQDRIIPKENIRKIRSGKQVDQGRRVIRQQQNHDDTPIVAFQATLSDHLVHAGENQIIAFDNVITNIGGAYNPHVGSFIAPVPGVYVFSATILGFRNSSSFSKIVKNGNEVVYLYVSGIDSTSGSDSATIVLHLNKGDDVVVQSHDSDVPINGKDLSMFGGFLLRKDYPGLNVIGK